MNLSALNTATAGKTRTTGISPFSELELSKVYANPEQPRKSFENIEELASSIVENGLIQPISVVKKTDGYMIIGGERRYRASIHAGLKTIRAHILQVDDKKVLELSLVENIQREDLTDFEKAQFIAILWESGHYTQKQDLAAAIGKSQSYISKALGTLKLDDAIIADMQEAKHDIGLSVLEEISRVPDKQVQKEVYKKIVSKEITRDDIKSFKSDKISPVKKEKISTGVWEPVPEDKISEKKLWVIQNNSHLSDYEMIIMIYNMIGGNFPSNLNDDIDKDKNYKITIEEL